MNGTPRAIPASLKEILGYGALLYIAGFLALRARLNFLGVHESLPLSDQLYLQFAGSFLATTVAFAFPLAFILFVAFAAIRMLWTRIRRPTAPPWLHAMAPKAALVAEFALAVALWKLTELQLHHLLRPGCAFSSFCADQAGELAEMVRRGEGAGAYRRQLVTLVFTGLVLMPFRRGASGIAPAPGWLAMSTGALLAFQTLMLPVAYALLAHPYTYPLVSIEASSGAIGLGKPQYILLESADHLVLSDGRTSMLHVERNQLKSYRTLCYANVLTGDECKSAKESHHVQAAATALRDAGTVNGSPGPNGASVAGSRD